MRTIGRRFLALIMLAGGLALVVAGLIGIRWYVWDVAISQAGQADRSMLFWGVPILFLAVGSVTVGALLGWTSRNLTRRRSAQSTDSATGAGS